MSTGLGEVVLYRTADGGPALDVWLERESVWLSQAQLVELFQRDQSVISRHVRNVFAEGELPEESNMQKMHIAGADKPATLVAMTLLIAESRPDEKDVLTRVVVNLINRRNP